jgi:hypothetical protein
MRADKLARLVEGNATTPADTSRASDRGDRGARSTPVTAVVMLRPEAPAAGLSRRAVSAVLDVLSAGAWADHVALVLHKHDADADGILRPSELRAAVAELGLPLLEAEVRQVRTRPPIGRLRALWELNAFLLCVCPPVVCAVAVPSAGFVSPCCCQLYSGLLKVLHYIRAYHGR